MSFYVPSSYGSSLSSSTSSTSSLTGVDDNNIDMKFDTSIKLYITGENSSGKTSLVQRFMDPSQFSTQVSTTIGCDYFSKVVAVDDVKVKVNIFDVPSRNRSRKQNHSSALQTADVIVICYDLSQYEFTAASPTDGTDKGFSSSYDSKYIAALLEESGVSEILGKKMVRSVAIIGTKSDLRQECCDTQQQQQYLHQEWERCCTESYPDISFFFFETSAKLNHNIYESFFTMISRGVANRDAPPSPLLSTTMNFTDDFEEDEKLEELISGELQYKDNSFFGKHSKWTPKHCSIKKLHTGLTFLNIIEKTSTGDKTILSIQIPCAKYELNSPKTSAPILKIVSEKPKKTIFLTDEKALVVNSWMTQLKNCGAQPYVKATFFISSPTESVAELL